jgi:predicted NACHT family NTPase
VKLDSNTIRELVELLSRDLEDERNRRSILLLALGNDVPVLQHITWSGAVATFIPDMVCKLADYGEVAPGRQALWALLEYVRSQAGVDVQQRIDKLRPLIDLQAHSCPPTDTSSSVETRDIDVLVQKVRSCLHKDIQRWHGTMPLWGVDHWVPLGDLFVDVNILEELSISRRSELDDLWQDFSKNPSYRSLDRIGMGEERQRVSGLEVLVKSTNLMVVGKPGSGKTTYLQRVVTECNAGNLQTHRIPVLIKLREFVEDGREVAYSLERYLERCWRLSDAETQLVLDRGRALVLLDGLDEVTGEDGKNITKEIKRFARAYPQVQVIVTCRTQSQESRFERFDYVEVADFNEPQVRAFAEHWFKTMMKDESAGLAKAQEFLGLLFLEANKPIRELAITPILLSLTCTVFYQTGKFYSKRSKLYEEGLELLLEQWDKSRSIERDEIYRDLSVERKLELLSYLAVKKFEHPKYVLFEQGELEGYIAEFLGIGQRDSRTVLRAIERQHGLLIARSQKVWSFSHLTFQEYFVAKYVVDNRTTQEEVFQHLEVHITKPYWREVFLLTVELLDNADNFLQVMKCKSDSFLAKDSQLQQFLNWVDEKSQCVPKIYSTVAIRAFYYALAHDSPGYFFEVNIDKNSINSIFDIDLALVTSLSFAEALTSNQNIINAFRGNFDNTRTLAIELGFTPGFKVGLTNRNDHENLLAEGISDSLNRACIHAANFKPQLEKPIKELLEHLHKFDIVPDLINFSETETKIDPRREWWRQEGKAWTEQLRELITKHQNVGYKWNFSSEQKQLLQCYSDANKLLIHCLNSGCVVSDRVREEIEEMLLLPIAEMQNRRGTRADF